MQARTHEVCGISIALIAAVLTSKPEFNSITYSATMVVGAAIGSILPDIDHRGSKVSKEHKIISGLISDKVSHRGITHSLVANAVVAFVCFALAGLFGIFYDNGVIGKLVISFLMTFVVYSLYARYPKFRSIVGILGKYTPFIVTFACTYYFAEVFSYNIYYFAAGITLGYFSHLLADACTVSGIAFLQPFNMRVFRFAKFKTGESEGKFRLICEVVTVLVVIILKRGGF